MSPQQVDIPLDVPARRHAHRARALAAWWRALPAPVRAPHWPAALGILVVLALLLGFTQVVRGAVHQGEVLRMTAATRAESVWRCNALPRASLRANCLAHLDAPPPGRIESTPPPNTAWLAATEGGG